MRRRLPPVGGIAAGTDLRETVPHNRHEVWGAMDDPITYEKAGSAGPWDVAFVPITLHGSCL